MERKIISLSDGIISYRCKRVAPNLNQIICVSGPSKQDIVDEFEVDPDKIEIILNGIDIEKFVPNTQKESQGYKLLQQQVQIYL